MKTASGFFVFLAMVSLNGWAQEADYDKRNAHIFCASHLTVVSDTFDTEGDKYQALTYLSGMHRKEAKKHGASAKDFADVMGYLKDIRENDPQKWNSLSAQSKRVCLAGS